MKALICLIVLFPCISIADNQSSDKLTIISEFRRYNDVQPHSLSYTEFSNLRSYCLKPETSYLDCERVIQDKRDRIETQKENDYKDSIERLKAERFHTDHN